MKFENVESNKKLLQVNDSYRIGYAKMYTKFNMKCKIDALHYICGNANHTEPELFFLVEVYTEPEYFCIAVHSAHLA